MFPAGQKQLAFSFLIPVLPFYLGIIRGLIGKGLGLVRGKAGVTKGPACVPEASGDPHSITGLPRHSQGAAQPEP